MKNVDNKLIPEKKNAQIKQIHLSRMINLILKGAK